MCHCMSNGCIYDHNSYSSHHAAFILITQSVIYSNWMSRFLLITLTLLPGKWAYHRFKWFWEGLLGQAKLRHYSSQFSWGPIIFGLIYFMCLPQFSSTEPFFVINQVFLTAWLASTVFVLDVVLFVWISVASWKMSVFVVMVVLSVSFCLSDGCEGHSLLAVSQNGLSLSLASLFSGICRLRRFLKYMLVNCVLWQCYPEKKLMAPLNTHSGIPSQ